MPEMEYHQEFCAKADEAAMLADRTSQGWVLATKTVGDAATGVAMYFFARPRTA